MAADDPATDDDRMTRDGHEPRVRMPVAAGRFYPRSPDTLIALVDELLTAARDASPPDMARRGKLRGIIVPHAGYEYTGPIAATAYALAADGPRPERLVILGPSHFEPLRGCTVPTHDAWLMPSGEIAIDDSSRRRAKAGGALADDRPHASEHSIEVQLPFIGRIWPGVPVLPIAVGHAGSDSAGWLDPMLSEDTLLVVSSDLSHYHDADTARRLDESTASKIEALDAADLRPDDACGLEPLRVAVAWARRAGLRARLLDLRDSSETTGDRDRVVGYGAFAFERPA